MEKDMSDTANTVEFESEEEELRAKILHLLSIYPAVSPTMLQVALGPYTRARQWKPILAELIEEGLVVRSEVVRRTIYGRDNSYTLLKLAVGVDA